MNKMDKKVIREVRKNIPGFEEYLQARYQLISEAVGDVITIARMNTYEDAVDLISKQFVVIDRQDLEEEEGEFE